MIKCLICNKEFKQLNSHLKSHNITPSEYCKKFNIVSTFSNEARKSISEKTKQSMAGAVVEHMKANWLSDSRKEFLKRRSEQMMGNVPGNRLTNEQFMEKLNKLFPNKFELLSDYTGSSKPVKVKCNDCGDIQERRPNYLYEYGCRNCNKINKVPRVNTWNRISPGEFKNNFNNKFKGEYELLSDYTKAEDKILVKHVACGHVWKVTARQIYSNGTGCPACAKKSSHFEDDIYNMIKSFYTGNIIRNSRDIIQPYELDIYVTDKNVAIEFNGTYWHSSLHKPKDYHYIKSKLCEEKGIRLIHIYEYEWKDERQRPILENIIKSALGSVENKIYARKCEVVEVPSKDMQNFFNKNNIQGFRSGKFSICLKYNNEIVMAYQMGSAYFGKGKYEWEVIRGATKLNTTVVGGASKIWKYFKEKYNPESCVYYIDYNYFNGNSISNIDSKFQYVTSQQSFKNYWVLEDKVKNREPKRHKEIKQLEKEGLVIPLYNAGTKVYVYTK